jgi:hypothetical protein
LVVPFSAIGDGFVAALLNVLRQISWCEYNGVVPYVQWGAAACGSQNETGFWEREPLYWDAACPNIWECFFEPVCPNLSTNHLAVCTDDHPGGCNRFLQTAGKNASWCLPCYVEPRVAMYLNREVAPCDEGEEDSDWHEETMSGFNCTFNAERERAIRQNRIAGAHYIARYVKVKPKMRQLVDTFARRHFRGAMLAVHIRGSDRLREEVIPPDRYLPLVRRYLAENPGAGVFVATEDHDYRAEITRVWVGKHGMRVVMRNISVPGGVHDLQHLERVTATATATAVREQVEDTGAHLSDAELRAKVAKSLAKADPLGGKPHHLLLRDCLADILLMARCQFFIHSRSGVSEAVFFFNPQLHFHSLDLQFKLGAQERWAYGNRRSGDGGNDGSHGNDGESTKVQVLKARPNPAVDGAVGGPRPRDVVGAVLENVLDTEAASRPQCVFGNVGAMQCDGKRAGR